jgi:cytochrome bd ubiquinol oxidase subunit II
MADAVGAILLASVTLYAVLGGADFGAGLWDFRKEITRLSWQRAVPAGRSPSPRC